MLRKVLALSIAILMANCPSVAVERPSVTTDWAGFREQVAQRKLRNRSVRIVLASGSEIKATLTRVEENGIMVRLNRATKQWATGKEEAVLPRQAVSSVAFVGKVGRGGLIGGLVGLGAGAAIAGAAAAAEGGGTCEGGSCGAVLLLIPVLAVGGWLIGRATEKPAPVFVIQP